MGKDVMRVKTEALGIRYGEKQSSYSWPLLCAADFQRHRRDPQYDHVARLMATRISGARFVTLEGSNHLILPGEPALGRSLDAIRNFLKDS
jgi:hypothetical protein